MKELTHPAGDGDFFGPDGKIVDLDGNSAAFERLWAAYHLAQRRTAALTVDDPQGVLEGAQFHETLLQHLAFGNEGEVVTPLRVTSDGVIVHVQLWEEEVKT